MSASVPDGAVLVTGAAGFIGSHVADALLARGEHVVVADEVNDYYDVRLKRANLDLLKSKWGPKVRVFQGDLCDATFVARLFAPAAPEGGGGAVGAAASVEDWPLRVDRVVHLAARAGVRPSIEDPFVYVQSNVEATTRLLEASRSGGVAHFVYASSSSVYGDSLAQSFAEADAVDHPVSPYAATKKTCELFAHTYTHLYDLPTSGLRFFTVYGPRGRPDMAPFKFVDRVARGLELQQFGDGSTSRDYTYIDDIVDGVVRALDRPNGYQIYNLGNGNPIALKRFIEIVQECVGKAANITVLPPQPGDVDRTCANVDKAKAELGFEARTSFEVGIAKTVAWYREVYTPQFGASPPDADAAADGSGGYSSAEPDDSSLPTEELHLWPGGLERRLRTQQRRPSGVSESDDDAPPTRRLPRQLPRALPRAATELLASLHIETRTNAQTAALTPAAQTSAQAALNLELNSRTWAGGDFGEGLPAPPEGSPAWGGVRNLQANARPRVKAHTFEEPIEF